MENNGSNEKKELQERYCSLSEEQLNAVLKAPEGEYVEVAVEAARAELERRKSGEDENNNINKIEKRKYFMQKNMMKKGKTKKYILYFFVLLIGISFIRVIISTISGSGVSESTNRIDFGVEQFSGILILAALIVLAYILIKNKKRVYVVKLGHVSDYRFPKTCHCCLKPTDEDLELIHSTGGPTGTFSSTVVLRSHRVTIPCCSKCKAHRSGGIILSLVISLVVALGTAMYVIHSVRESGEEKIMGIVFLVISILCWLLLINIYFIPNWIEKKLKEEGHSALRGVTKFSVDDDGKYVFEFKNKNFASVFAELNNSNVSEKLK